MSRILGVTKKYDFFEVSLFLAGFTVPLVWLELRLGLLTLTVTEVMTVLMLVGFVIRVRRGDLSPQLSVPDKIYLLLIIWTSFSLFRAIDPAKTLREWLWLVESGLIFYMVEHAVRDKEEFKRLLKAWSYGAVIVSLIGLAHYFSSIATGNGPIRIYSTLLNANTLSGYLIVYIPILIGIKYGKRIDQRYFWGVLATILSTALVASYTRGGWLAIIISLGLMVTLLKDKRLLAIILVYICIYSWTFPSVSERAATGVDGTDFSSNYRTHLWLVGLKMWQEHPLEGVGVGNYLKLHESYVEKYPELGQGFKPLEPHNSFIKYLAETGIVGFSTFLMFLTSLGSRLLKTLQLYRDKESYPILVGTLCGFVAFLLQSNTNSLFHDPRVAFGALAILGLLASITRTQEMPIGITTKRSFPKNSVRRAEPRVEI